MRGANLAGSLLIAANLRHTDLSGANLIGADLRDADIRDANLADCLFLTQNSGEFSKRKRSNKNYLDGLFGRVIGKIVTFY